MKKQTIILVLLLASTVCGYGQSNIPYGNNKAVGKYIEINGVKHYYEVYGAGAPLLLIHGNGTGIKGHALQIDYFATKYQVYAIDCRGRGNSELGPDTLTYIQQAKDMAEFVRLMGLDSVSIIGKSDGGIIGILMAIYYPQHIKKIVSFGANMSPDSTALYPRVIEDMTKERKHAEKMLMVKDQTKNWELERQRNRLMEFQPHISAVDLSKIKIPVLVMSCDRDVIKLEHSLFIYNNIPQASIAILAGETHIVARKNATLFNSTIDKFLSQPFKADIERYNLQ